MNNVIVMALVLALIIGFLPDSTHTDAQVGNYQSLGELSKLVEELRQTVLLLSSESRDEAAHNILVSRNMPEGYGWWVRIGDGPMTSEGARVFILATDYTILGETYLDVIRNHIIILEDME